MKRPRIYLDPQRLAAHVHAHDEALAAKLGVDIIFMYDKDRSGRPFLEIIPGRSPNVSAPGYPSTCRFCGIAVTPGDRICEPCNTARYGVNRFGGEVPAGVDW